MKAMVLAEPGAPFVMEERPIPVAGPGEAVARVLACGSGLTIEHTRAGRMGGNFPLVIGHEITGEITQVGAGVEGLQGRRARDGVLLFHLRALPLVPREPRDLVRESRRPSGPPDGRRLRRVHQAARPEFHPPARGSGLQGASRRGRRHLGRHRHAVQGDRPRGNSPDGERGRGGRGRRRGNPHGDDGALGGRARHRRRYRGRKTGQMPRHGRARDGGCVRREPGRGA